MNGPSIPLHRVKSQLLADRRARTARDVVAHFGAMQAQDFLGSLWAVGLRMRNATEGGVERALNDGTIVRCWPMRGTLHVVAAEDVRWMIDLLAPRVLKRHRMRLERDFELDAAVLRRCRTLVESALRGHCAKTRAEIYDVLEKSGIATGNGRGLHILFALAHERLVCFGPRRGKQPSFVLLEEWIPPAKEKTREEALAEIARRYAAGHAPATVADFAWWTGLTSREAAEAFDLAGIRPEAIAGGAPRTRRLSVHLLPPFDEYTVGYKDRSTILDSRFTRQLNAGGGMLNAVIVVNGVVEGTWKRTLRGSRVEIAVSPFRTLSSAETQALEREASRYARFLGVESSLRTSLAGRRTARRRE